MEFLKLINSYINYIYYILIAIILIMLIVVVIRLLAILKSIGVKKDNFSNIVIYLKHIQESTEKIQYTIEHSLPDIMKVLLVLSFLNSIIKDYFKTKKGERSIRRSFVRQANIQMTKSALKKTL